MAGAAVLAGCAAPEMRGLVQMPGTRIALQQQPQGGFEVLVGENTHLPLPDHLSPRIEGMWIVGAHRLVLIEGTLKSCAARSYLLVTKDNEASIRPLGKCDDRFGFTWSADQLQARQLSVRDPAIWSFRDGKLTGPVLQSALNRRGRGPAAATATDRPAEATGAEPAPREPEAEPIRDAVTPPPVSKPVGEDVIPSPVGGGPLPQQPQRPPRLF